MDENRTPKGVDVSIDHLVPLHEREVRKNGYNKILASIRAIGLIEPLLVFEEAGKYVILDGYLRYRACLELGVPVIPCLLSSTKEAYTPNRMVNFLSQVQESRMIRQSQGTLDPATIAKTLGLSSIKHRIKEALLRHLDPEVVRVFDQRSIPLRMCARDLMCVKPEYQRAILAEMEKAGDFSPAFARMFILKAPDEMRNIKGKRKTPWNRGLQHKKLANKLEEVSRQHDFYSELYRDYVADLLKLSVYVRKLITTPRIADYIRETKPEIWKEFQEIIFESRPGETK